MAMSSFHRPRVYRSIGGCCICRAKSSSSRFTTSDKYENLFQACFRLPSACPRRSGEICNACVLLVKRYQKLPINSNRHWAHVVDARAGPGVKNFVKVLILIFFSYYPSPAKNFLRCDVERAVGSGRWNESMCSDVKRGRAARFRRTRRFSLTAAPSSPPPAGLRPTPGSPTSSTSRSGREKRSAAGQSLSGQVVSPKTRDLFWIQLR